MSKISIDDKKIIKSFNYHIDAYTKEFSKFFSNYSDESDIDLGLLASALYHLSIANLIAKILFRSGDLSSKGALSSTTERIKDLISELQQFEFIIGIYIRDNNKKEFDAALGKIIDRVNNPKSYLKYPTKS